MDRYRGILIHVIVYFECYDMNDSNQYKVAPCVGVYWTFVIDGIFDIVLVANGFKLTPITCGSCRSTERVLR